MAPLGSATAAPDRATPRYARVRLACHRRRPGWPCDDGEATAR